MASTGSGAVMAIERRDTSPLAALAKVSEIGRLSQHED
jgi:hypothetical protein